MDQGQSRSSLAVPESAILEACGETPLPEMGVIEQAWETDPIPAEEVADRAGEAFRSLPLADVPDGGEIALGEEQAHAKWPGELIRIVPHAVVRSIRNRPTIITISDSLPGSSATSV